jgi:dUTP pyrophosphatase
MKVRIKKLNPQAIIPSYAKAGDAGMDLTAVTMEYDNHGNISYGTGLAVEIPKGYVGLIFPRSSVSKTQLALANSVGVIDSGYRGELICKFKPTLMLCDEGSEPEESVIYKEGERVAQLMIIPHPEVEFEESEELEKTERGNGGFGSTN